MSTLNKIDNIPLCFASGTHIMTEFGDRMIQSLKIGDNVLTRDHGCQEIRWVGSRKMQAVGETTPIVIKKGTFHTTRDLIVSPKHRMLFQGRQAELMFGQKQVLVSAKDLLNNDGVFQVASGFVEYFHMLFDRHEIIYAEAAATESYHPNYHSLANVSDASRDEIFNILPELRSIPNAYGPTARTCLKSHEGRLITL